jgi:pyruvate dehydrogenase E2 component (dihydrolipoamide acetyltransferase)
VEQDVLDWLERQPKATPVARKMAVEAGLDLATLSHITGRITADSVKEALAAREAEAPAPAAAAPEAATLAPSGLPGLRGIIADHMASSHLVTAPVTLTAEADATALVAMREDLKASLADELAFNVGYNDLLILVAAKALREFPYMNVQLTEQNGEPVIQRMDAVNVGLAVDTERGLVVPVIHNADQRGLRAIATELREMVARAREGQSLPDDFAGGTFTITNLGMYGVDAFTPIINTPECAILGVGRIKAQPAVVDGAVVVRQKMWLSLTFDHRLVDGAPAARFLGRLVELVEEPYLLLA